MFLSPDRFSAYHGLLELSLLTPLRPVLILLFCLLGLHCLYTVLHVVGYLS
jgi:hypothetical protein